MEQLSYSSATVQMPEFLRLPTPNLYANRQDMYEYMLVISPDENVKKQLAAERETFLDKYKTGTQDGDDTGITVMSFAANEDMEATIIKWIQRICGQQESFIVTINNYSGYPPNRIHLRVQYTLAFQRLGKELKVIDNYVKSCGLPAAKISNHPHLTLARRVSEDVYRKAMFDYAQRDFYGSFAVSELVLLKRKHQFEKAKRINVFGLLPGLATTAYNEPLLTY
jgi:2'-5' RNA ligase